jgi:hypothetical protein
MPRSGGSGLGREQWGPPRAAGRCRWGSCARPARASRTRPTAAPGSRRQASARRMGRSERERAASRRSAARIPARPCARPGAGFVRGTSSTEMPDARRRGRPARSRPVLLAAIARRQGRRSQAQLGRQLGEIYRRIILTDPRVAPRARLAESAAVDYADVNNDGKRERLIHHAAGNHGTALRVMG